MPDAQQQDRRCGTCGWWGRENAQELCGDTFARCRYAPLPAWVTHKGRDVTSAKAGTRCEAWREIWF